MAEIVLGIGTSHTPMISLPPTHWTALGMSDQTSPHLPPDIEAQLAPDAFQQKHAAAQAAIKILGDTLRGTPDLDAIVIFGDDQHEQFLDENMPSIAIYHGERFPVGRRNHGTRTFGWAAVEESHWEETQPEYSTHVGLADHLITSLTDQEFEITRCNALRAGVGIGHAFSFLYRRLWGDCPVPIVPIMLNTYFPPNTPSPTRCHRLGQAVRASIEQWTGGKRVAIMASGGLTHVLVDEILDRQVLAALQANDPALISALPREQLVGGTSEGLNWVAAAGALGPLKLELIDYIPAYRSNKGSGCALTFARWQ